MILQEIQHYLQAHPQVSLAELEQHFKVEADALRGMLEKLIRKKRVRKQETKKCGGCHCCSSTSLEFYEWVNTPF